jgi:hypothetical protein
LNTIVDVEQRLAEMLAGAKKREGALAGAVMKATLKKNKEMKMVEII